MNTPNIKQHIKSLQDQVNQIIDTDSKFSFMPDVSSPKIYVGISLFILVVLLFLKPSFVKYKDEKEKIYKLSFKKLIMGWIVLSVIAFAILFVYNRTNK